MGQDELSTRSFTLGAAAKQQHHGEDGGIVELPDSNMSSTLQPAEGELGARGLNKPIGSVMSLSSGAEDALNAFRHAKDVEDDASTRPLKQLKLEQKYPKLSKAKNSKTYPAGEIFEEIGDKWVVHHLLPALPAPTHNQRILNSLAQSTFVKSGDFKRLVDAYPNHPTDVLVASYANQRKRARPASPKPASPS